jgi:dTDP-4-dehydrorhamnose 3,5-epimerase
MSTGLIFTPLRRIASTKGEVRHGLRASDPGFSGFGEVYFSEVLSGTIKGWKRHTQMTMNLVVVSGTIRFILHDGVGANTEFVISAEDAAPYGRLTVPPGFWMAFEGLGEHNLVMNLASHEHDPTEAENLELDAFPYSPSSATPAST